MCYCLEYVLYSTQYGWFSEPCRYLETLIRECLWVPALNHELFVPLSKPVPGIAIESCRMLNIDVSWHKSAHDKKTNQEQRCISEYFHVLILAYTTQLQLLHVYILIFTVSSSLAFFIFLGKIFLLFLFKSPPPHWHDTKLWKWVLCFVFLFCFGWEIVEQVVKNISLPRKNGDSLKCWDVKICSHHSTAFWKIEKARGVCSQYFLLFIYAAHYFASKRFSSIAILLH